MDERPDLEQATRSICSRERERERSAQHIEKGKCCNHEAWQRHRQRKLRFLRSLSRSPVLSSCSSRLLSLPTTFFAPCIVARSTNTYTEVMAISHPPSPRCSRIQSTAHYSLVAPSPYSGMQHTAHNRYKERPKKQRKKNIRPRRKEATSCRI